MNYHFSTLSPTIFFDFAELWVTAKQNAAGEGVRLQGPLAIVSLPMIMIMIIIITMLITMIIIIIIIIIISVIFVLV